MSKPLTAQELENIPGSPAWNIKHHGLFETKIGENAAIITKGLGRYLVHDDQGNQIGSGETPGAAMLSATVFGSVPVTLDDEDDQECEEEAK